MEEGEKLGFSIILEEITSKTGSPQKRMEEASCGKNQVLLLSDIRGFTMGVTRDSSEGGGSQKALRKEKKMKKG